MVDYGIKGVGEDLFNDATLRPYIDQLRNLTDFVGDITNAYKELPTEGFERQRSFNNWRIFYGGKQP